MTTRQELRNCLRDLIVQAAKSRQTELALGREVVVRLSGVLAQARPTFAELQALLGELEGAEELQELDARVSWHGNARDEGQDVILLTAREV